MHGPTTSGFPDDRGSLERRNLLHVTQQQPGIDPDDLATTLRVLASLHHLPGDHPDHVTVKRAASHMYKSIKAERKLAKRAAELAHDRDIIERTATGSPMRIDDETAGIPLVSTAAGAFAGELLVPRGCYICKQDFTLVDAFYHWLCPSCAAMSHAKRDQRTDLTGKRALLTGGRAKIGMYIALRLLRDGAHTTITTRFPKDAVRRFSALPDSDDWIHRLKVVGIDLRDPTQVISLADDVAAAGPLDILINNACQTVRRTPGAYAPLVEAESLPLPDDSRSRRWSPSTASPRRTPPPSPARSSPTRRRPPRGRVRGARARPRTTPRPLTALALKAGARLPRRAPGRHRRRRRRAAARHADQQLVDPDRRRGRPAGAPRGAAVQLDRAVPAGLPAAPGAARPPRRQRPRGGPTSSTSPPWRASSRAATRAPGTRTPTWPRPRST